MNQILFQLNRSVTLAGENIEGICYIRIADDIQNANVQILFICVEYSKILTKRQIPFDHDNPQMIPEQMLEKDKQIQITLDSPRVNQNYKSKNYELHHGNMYQVTRQYGSDEDYTYTQDLYRGAIAAGCYKLPLQIPTKFTMNSSFNYKSKNGFSQAKIFYKIYLNISDTKTNKVILSKGIPIYMNSRHREQEQLRQSEGNIVSFCCLHKGMIELQIRVLKNVYKPGDVLEFEYILNSTRTQKGISKVEVKFIHYMFFTDNDENEKQIQKKLLHEHTMVGLSAGKKSELLKHSFQLPKDLLATVKTKFIKNHYLLIVEAFANGLLTSLAIPVVCQIPIIILELKKQQQPNLESWSFISDPNNLFNNYTIQQQQLLQN